MSSKAKVIILLVVAGFLSACATVRKMDTDDNDYLKQSKTVASTKLPSNLSMSESSYYPIPPLTMGPMQQSNIAPPGSQLMQRQPQQAVATPASRASAVIASSSNALVLNIPFAQAWKQVGKALAASGYKVMQQDQGIGTYFILDLASTDGQLKANTPIYQLHLKPSGGTTSVTLFDDQGHPANVSVASRIMNALKRNL